MGDSVETKEPKAKRARARAVPGESAGAAAEMAQSAAEAAETGVVTAAAATPGPVEAAAVPVAAPVETPALVEAAATLVASERESTSAVEAALANEGTEEMATVTTPGEGIEKGQAMFGDMTARFKTAFEKSAKIGEELVDFTKGNVEAFVASARVAAKASESLGQEAAEYGKKHLESATAAFKSFASVKSPTELFQLQSEYAKSAFDSAVAEASRVSESLMKVAGDIAQPISNRYAVAAEKFKAATL